jgi:hypothetical protein
MYIVYLHLGAKLQVLTDKINKKGVLATMSPGLGLGSGPLLFFVRSRTGNISSSIIQALYEEFYVEKI